MDAYVNEYENKSITAFEIYNNYLFKTYVSNINCYIPGSF